MVPLGSAASSITATATTTATTITTTATGTAMLSYDFMLRAFAASGMVAVVAGVVGYFLVLRAQDVGLALEIATRGYVLDTGRIIIDGPSQELLLRDDIRAAYLGLH